MGRRSGLSGSAAASSTDAKEPGESLPASWLSALREAMSVHVDFADESGNLLSQPMPTSVRKSILKCVETLHVEMVSEYDRQQQKQQAKSRAPASLDLLAVPSFIRAFM